MAHDDRSLDATGYINSELGERRRLAGGMYVLRLGADGAGPPRWYPDEEDAMTPKSKQPPVYTADLDEGLVLVTGAEVDITLADIGLAGERGEYGALLVGTHEGDYVQVWGASTSVPGPSTRWYDLLD